MDERTLGAGRETENPYTPPRTPILASSKGRGLLGTLKLATLSVLFAFFLLMMPIIILFIIAYIMDMARRVYFSDSLSN
jgi:hypothetical protein